MNEIADNIDVYVYYFFISIPRIMVILSMLPFLTESVMPTVVRGAFSITLSVAAIPIIVQNSDFTDITIVMFLLLGAKEALIGLVIGFVISAPFWAVSSAGFLVDLQRGAFSATLFTPFFRDSVSSSGILLVQGAAALLFISGGFLALLEIIYLSYVYIPTDTFFGSGFFDKDIFIEESARVFRLAFIFAAPMVIMMFCVDFTLGIANKFVPELNVFFVSMPIKSLLAMFILALYVPTLFGSFGNAFTATLTLLKTLVNL